MNKININELMRSYFGRTIDLSYEIVKHIETTELENQVEAIQEACEVFEYVESDASIEIENYISDKELEELKIKDGELVNQILEGNLKKTYLMEGDKEEFYTFLWNEIVQTFSDIKDRAFSLYYILIDRRIPYYPVKIGLKMSEEDFRSYRKQNINSILKTKFVLYNTYSQKTEEASILLDEIMGLEKYEDKVIVLAAILDTFRQEQKRLRERLRETE